MQPPAPSTFPPPLALLAELLGAIVGGFVFALLLALVVSLIFANAGLGMGLLTLQVYAGIIGFGVGAGVGAAGAGRLMQQSGSMWLAILVGVIIGVVVAAVPRLSSVRLGLLQTLAVGAALAIIGAVVAYNLRRSAP